MSGTGSRVETSQWPLPESGRRVVIPHGLVAELASHPLCRDCLPHGAGFYPCAAGHHMDRSAPRDHLLMYCLAGAGEACLEGDWQPISAGDVMLFREGCPHRYRADPDDPWTLYWVHLGGDRVDDYFDAVLDGPDAFIVQVGRHPRLTEGLDALLTTVTRFRSHHLIYAASQLKSLLSYMALMRHQRQEYSDALDVARVQAWLRSRLHERVELDTLVAATSELSRYHFIREYKRQTGQTPMQAFQHLKVSRACYLLDMTDLSVADIAQQLGHDDPYYFSRLFKKVMGMAPRDYRREHLAGDQPPI